METSIHESHRSRDIEFVSEQRSSRLLAVEKSSMGHIDDVLGEGAEVFGHVYVVKLLDVVPGVGKVAGRRLLSAIGLNGFSVVSHLTVEQREKILEASRAAK